MARFFTLTVTLIVIPMLGILRAQPPIQPYKTPPGELATVLDAPMLPTIEVEEDLAGCDS